MKNFFVGTLILTAMFCMFAMGCDPDPVGPVEPVEPVEPIPGTGVTDTDGNFYNTVILGDQEWMAENLNHETASSWCYNEDPGNCEIYGRLYTWFTARNACPAGWRLPSDRDWQRLVNALGGYDIAGGKMKATGSVEEETGWWHVPNADATNESSFTGLPGGIRDTDNSFNDAGYIGIWWSTSGDDASLIWTHELDYSKGSVERTLNDKQIGLSVRCIRN